MQNGSVEVFGKLICKAFVGKANFIIFNKGKERTVEVDFTDSPIANIAF